MFVPTVVLELVLQSPPFAIYIFHPPVSAPVLHMPTAGFIVEVILKIGWTADDGIENRLSKVRDPGWGGVAFEEPAAVAVGGGVAAPRVGGWWALML